MTDLPLRLRRRRADLLVSHGAETEQTPNGGRGGIMKKLLGEFRDFISKGNVIDMAVGVIIGAAFGAIVNSLVGDILSPIIGLVANTHLNNLVWEIGEVKIGYGAFLTAVINFLLMAIVLFFIIKTVDKAHALGKRLRKENGDVPPPAPAIKKCPYCLQEIAMEATRCPYCTSQLGQK